jgi:hypothetical protein
MFSLPLPRPTPVNLLGRDNESSEVKLLKKGFAHSMIVFTTKTALQVPGAPPPAIDDLNALVFVTFLDGQAGLVPLNHLHWGVPQ